MVRPYFANGFLDTLQVTVPETIQSIAIINSRLIGIATSQRATRHGARAANLQTQINQEKCEPEIA